MAISQKLQDAREEFATKQAALAEIMDAAYERESQKYNLGKKEVLEKLAVHDQKAAEDRVKELNTELDDLQDDLSQLAMKEVRASIDEREGRRQRPVRGESFRHSGEPEQRRDFGKMFTDSAEFKALKNGETIGVSTTLDISMKTLFQTSAGFAPESIRSGLIVPDVEFSLAELLALIPVFSIDQANFVYMQETTRTHASAETAEGVAYPESTFVFAEQTSPVRKIADSIPVTDEQLEDETQVASLLDQRLRFGLRQRLANQILNGDGIAPNLEGILNVTGIQTQALGADDIFTAAYKAITLIRFTGQAEPSAFVFHPNDWSQAVLAQASTGSFVWGHPAMVPQTRLWGLPVALSTGIAEGTALVGDFRTFARIDERRGVEVQAGFVGTQFTEGKQTLRADMRAAFTVTRPAAFATITGV